MKEITHLEAYVLMKSSKGQFFHVGFVKKDGSNREMTCRLGVTKGVKGIGLAFDPFSKLLLTVFDVAKKEFRMVNLKTVHTLRINKQEYAVRN